MQNPSPGEDHTKQRTFSSMIKDHSISPQNFFGLKGIVSDVKSHLDKFIQYCKRHRVFTERMITLALNITYQELENPQIKKASHAINEILSSEEDKIVQLFLEVDTCKNSSQISEHIIEEQSSIRTEAERLFNFDDEDDQVEQLERPIEVDKFEVIQMSLEILKHPEINQTCLGYLHKIFSFLIRNNPQLVLSFFKSHQNHVDLMMENLKYSSVGSLISQLLASEDKSKQYLHESFKKDIMSKIIQQVFKNISSEDSFDGIILLIDEIFNTTRQSYYEFFEDFKRAANQLVSKDFLEKIFGQLLKLDEKSFKNTSKFLECLFCRINSQKQDNNYYNREEIEPTMSFQTDIFYDSINELISLIPKIDHFNSLTKISYATFLNEVFKSNLIKKVKICLDQNFLKLNECLNAQKKAGIYRNKLHNLIISLIDLASVEDIEVFLTQNKGYFENYFTSLKSANYDQTKVYNKHQSSCFDISIIKHLKSKRQEVIKSAEEATKKNLKRIFKKYDTKIANFAVNSNLILEDQTEFYQFNNDFKEKRQESSEGGLSLNLVGKNNISIPTLHLPDKVTESYDKKDEKVEISELRIDISNLRTSNEVQPIMASKKDEANKKKEVSPPVQSSKTQPEQQQAKYYLRHAIIFV